MLRSISCIMLAFACVSAPAFAQGQSSSNVLYLKEEVSVVSSSGVTSLPPGTAVTSLGEGKEGIKVKTAEGATTVVKQAQVTKDQAEAQRLVQAEAIRQANAQAAMAQAIEQQRQAAARNAELVNQSAAQSASSQPAAAAPAATPSASLQRTDVKYEAEEANVKVTPFKFKKKKKK